MAWRKHWVLLSLVPVIIIGTLFALITWRGSAPGPAVTPDGRAYFATSTANLISVCDANHDDTVDGADLASLKLYWNGFPEPEIDCNHDGFINGRDLAILMGEWTGSPAAAPDAQALPAMAVPDATVMPFRVAIPSADANNSLTGEHFTALILLTGGVRRIGAGQVELTYDPAHLAVRAIHTSPGIWTAWTERPQPPYGSHLVFAGGRPGGFVGTMALLGEVEFEVLAPGPTGLGIAPESVAYGADPAGTPVPMPSQAPTGSLMVYDGLPSVSLAEKALPPLTRLPALLTPTPSGQAWIVDLSSLTDPGDVATFEITDGQSHLMQKDDAYVLESSALATHTLQVVVHHEDGSLSGTTIALDGLPGLISFGGWWARLGFWIIVELVLALVLLGLVIHRHPV